METQETLEEAIAHLKKLVEGIEVAMLTTVDKEGHLRSRPMGTQEVDKHRGLLWFFSNDLSAKALEIRQDQRVNLSYADPKSQRFVSVTGKAEIMHSPVKVRELWKPSLKTWFPDGPNDPHLALIKVKIDQAEYWDTPSSGMLQVKGFFRALTGQTPEASDVSQAQHQLLRFT